ncbi:hypothetical protein [Ideonella livida]|uniref:PBP domain-containing protein n=1 Tax=Ideonella livida TaxID=2707176 RepID=A0A7C9PKD1_9BURK|nr:hypothetical protein [Ideonella livida]NDY93192.1 hypothetical protein [Ideonella livida]
MQVRLIALAALASCGASHALTPAQIDAARAAGTLKEVYVAGASAQRLFVGAWFQEQCKPTTFDVFFNGTGAAPSGSNHRAYSCELNKKVGNWAAGTKVLFVKRDQGGSTQGVVPVASGAAQDFMAVDGTCTATGKPSPATDILNAGFACNNVFSRLADAGVSDVEPALLNKPVNLLAPAVAVATTSLDVGTINQTVMAVAVNKKAYRALQEAQGLIGAGAALDDDPAKQPSLPRTFVSAAFSGKLSGGTADRRGWNVVIPASVDADVENKQVNVCRRNVGSGTQASFNAEFLNNDCSNVAGNKLAVLGQTTGTTNSTVVAPTTTAAALGTQWWNLGSGSGNVETCLGSTVENAAGTAYAIGVLSRENTPTPTGTTTDKGYRFVKLDGIAPTRDNAKVGAYGFVYAATMQWNKTTLTDTAVKSFLSQMRSNAGRAASLSIADVDTQEGVLAPPTTYSGPYAALTDAVTLKFASRVARNTSASCSPLAIVK